MFCYPLWLATFEACCRSKLKLLKSVTFNNQVDQLATRGRQMLDVVEDHINGLTTNSLRGFPSTSSKLQVFSIPSALLLLLSYLFLCVLLLAWLPNLGAVLCVWTREVVLFSFWVVGSASMLSSITKLHKLNRIVSSGVLGGSNMQVRPFAFFTLFRYATYHLPCLGNPHNRVCWGFQLTLL